MILISEATLNHEQSNHTPFDVLLVEDNAMLDAILAGRTVEEAFPTLKRFVLMAPGSEADESKRAITWQQMIDLGEAVPESRLDDIEEEQFVNEACVLVYTSGTTGKPKGVMVSQVRVARNVRIGVGRQWIK